MNISVVRYVLFSSAVTFFGGCGGDAVTPDNTVSTPSQNSSSSASSVTSGSSTNVGLANIENGYANLPDGRGGFNVEATIFTPEMGFNKSTSLEAFKETVYPIVLANCSACHSTINASGSGAQAPLHADKDPELAHEYALTRVNFREPEESKLVTRLSIDRHNCFGNSCQDAANQMVDAIETWRDSIDSMITEVPRGVPQSTQVSEAEVMQWIADDRTTIAASDQEFIQYTSLHELHNAGVSAQNLNHARVAVSKILNSVARWAPEIVNPVDVNGKGILYRFDIRDYWGWTGIDTSANNFQLFYGGSDDDLAFADKVDLNGNSVSYFDLSNMRNRLKPSVTRDDKFARLVWARVLKGNAEGADGSASLTPYIDGFIGQKQRGGNGQEFVAPQDLEYVEASQLVFTLSRPDVYNAIMALPGYSNYTEEEIGVDKSRGMDSYDYVLTYEAITIDSRMYWRAEQDTGRGDYYWKTFDTFTQGDTDIDRVYQNEQQRYPFWANPIPKFISTQQGGTTPDTFAMVATVNLFNNGDGRFDGSDGGQQSAEEVIWSLPNGMQGYALFGAFNQRRVDAFTNIVRDPRLNRNASDAQLDNLTGFGRGARIPDIRLNNGSSCFGCHVDGMNRGNNDLRDWLDEDSSLMPSGQYGADAWRHDAATVARVKELYPPSTEIRALMEKDRAVFLEAMSKVKEMSLGVDKNTYVEPIIWAAEWARERYQYPYTRSN